MEATFVVNPKEIDAQVLERMLSFFVDKERSVIVHMTEAQPKQFDFHQLFQGMEAIRMRTELVPIPVNIGDINELIDSVNDMDFDQP
ncbi:hypothetical protein ACFSUS_10000 [Spirosoma soli]|uniref:STAS domain-containing protein n=1 Tax=Spirosoma soli TaxID=1770529 RepID=A0ABW5M4D1_9BACT